MKFFLVRSQINGPIDAWWPHLDAHLKFQKEQHDRGAILVSGPDRNDNGMWLVRAVDETAVETLVAQDPFVALGLATTEIIEWRVHQIMGIGPFEAAGMPNAYLDETAPASLRSSHSTSPTNPKPSSNH